MKKIFTFLISFFIATISLFAQAPEGIIYQAEARDNNGNIIKNKSLDVTIQILENSANGAIVWEGIHNVTTNNLGIFVLVIGTGTNIYGYNFEEIDWGNNSHFLNVQVKDANKSNWIDMGTTQFLSVPYALHAKTAESLISESGTSLKSAKTGVPSQTWSLFGNSKTDATMDKLGTTDAEDLVFVTDNIERLRITKEGKLLTADGVGLELGGNLAVHGDSTYIDKDLYVGRSVYLNVNEEFDPLGETFNYGNFTVEGTTNLNAELNVNNEKPTVLSGELTVYQNADLQTTLNVGGETNLNGDLSVNNTAPTLLTGTLQVNKDAQFENDLTIKNNLSVEKTISSKALLVKDELSTGEYLATFENTDNGEGDGIKIKLGKAGSKVDGAVPDLPFPNFVPNTNKVQDIISLLDKDGSNKITKLGTIITDAQVEDLASIIGLTSGIYNALAEYLNTTIDIKIPDVTLIPEISGLIEGGAIDKVSDALDLPLKTSEVPGLRNDLWPNLPTLPANNNIFPVIDVKDQLKNTIPDLNFNDISDPLDNTNNFILFTDANDKEVGGIKGQSIQNWVTCYLDPVYIMEIYSTFHGIDKAKVKFEVEKEFVQIISAYNKIGVEYSSGNGDYAEWLERLDPNEDIGTGDIVAVKAGKITKDLTNAEQVMAVSHRPIVLGNLPPKGKSHLGNNIAFMGQIPVKVMGEVKTGDYIVGDGQILGYGIAVHPEEMKVEDFKFAVGRAWEEDLESGPKMVNTVIGIHNGDYLNILKKYEQKFIESESRLESVEAKIDVLTNMITQKHEAN